VNTHRVSLENFKKIKKIEQVIPFGKTLGSIKPSAMGFKGIELSP